MHQQLKMLCKIITETDNDPLRSMSYITLASPTTNVTNCPPKNAREVLIREALHLIQHNVLANSNCDQVDDTIQPLINKLSNLYTHRQHLCWRSHQHHFHPDFLSYVNCPMTCLAEISEYLEKLTKEMYTNA